MMGRPTGAHVFGPLQPLVRGFLLELIELGYGWGPQSERLRLMAQLSAWMAREGIEPPELTASLIGEFLAPLRAQGPKRGWFSPTSERQLVDYLRRLGLNMHLGRWVVRFFHLGRTLTSWRFAVRPEGAWRGH